MGVQLMALLETSNAISCLPSFVHCLLFTAFCLPPFNLFWSPPALVTAFAVHCYGCDMHYTYLVSVTLRCSGIVLFCGVCSQAVWYVAFLTLCQNKPRGPEFESGWGEFSAPGICGVLSS